MFTKRFSKTAGRRLRVEGLEVRTVPAAITGTTTSVMATVEDSFKPADPVEVTTMADGEIDPQVIFTMNANDSANPSIDLAATASIDKVKPSIGDVVTVSFTAKNNGPDAATGVTMSTTLPAGLAFVAAEPAAGTGAYDQATGNWAAGIVPANGTAVLKIKARITDAAEQSLAASISHSDQTDPDSTNNATNVTVTPVLASVYMSKSANVANPAVGSVITMTLVVRNAGPGTARNIAVADTLGEGLTFIRALPPTRGSFVSSTKTWNITTLPAGTVGTLQIVAQVKAIGRVESPATLTGTGIDTSKGKLDATAIVTGMKANTQATWSYYSGVGFKVGQGPVPASAKANIAMPATPILASIPLSSAVAQILIARGFILPTPTL
jgi:uncharacterized repeat protein (TIGR01451 family)